MHVCVQENKKSLVVYVVESFWNQLEMFGQLKSIQDFRLKYQEVETWDFCFLHSVITVNFLSVGSLSLCSIDINNDDIFVLLLVRG